MGRHWFALRLSLLVCSIIITATNGDADPFTSLPTPPWIGRSNQGFGFLSQSASYRGISSTSTNTNTLTSITAPAGSLVAFGGSSGGSDVWLSTDIGQTWYLISGRSTSHNMTATSTSTITGAGNGCALYDRANHQFYSLTPTRAYVSSDAVTWTPGPLYGAPNGFTSMGCTISQSGTIYLLGGTQTGVNGTDANNVWQSTNYAQNWTQSTTAAQWSQRDTVGSWTQYSPFLGKTILTIYSGGPQHNQILDDGTNLGSAINNQVWASSDSGASWRLLGFGSFTPRDHTVLGTQVSSAGVVVITSGKVTVNGSTYYANDVWASFDGGITWGVCTPPSGGGFTPREDPSTAMDPSGFFYVSGGQDISGNKILDLWRSPFSFNDLNAVASNCGLVVPTCGVGLQCWPTSDGVFSGCNPTSCSNTVTTSSSTAGSSTRSSSSSSTNSVASSSSSIQQSPSSSTGSVVSPGSSDSSSSSLSGGGIAGIVIGCVAGASLLFVLCWCLLARPRAVVQVHRETE